MAGGAPAATGVRLGQGYRYGRPVALAPITEAKPVSQLVS